MLKLLSKDRQKGFTMIEIIVSVFIMAALTSIFLANYHSVGQKSVLNVFAQEVASDISLMENYALASYEYNGAISAGGWGFYIDNLNNKYILFADTNENKEYDSPGELFKSVDFPDNITIDDIYTSSSLNSVNVTFVPPVPVVNIGDALNSYDDLVISFKNNTDDSIKKINLNYFGLIEVEKN